ncbi:acyltransferase family protein [Lentilactobacillus fungorum]|uniref:acyltransferase family protein n=1 Tax=Lentilactobacillus fungorum TaxID=2201250 RepID=UPI001943EF3E|nr:acyltransferase family protein [Lentilactobacillus fungorum]
MVKSNPQQNLTTADIGDYLKLAACTAVMLQTILSFSLTTNPSHQVQTWIGIAYNFTKFTAPAFIFGILYTTIRTFNPTLTYHHYLHNQWRATLVPTIWWTSIYLLTMPGLQQVNHYHTLIQFGWQFINGNAAPHLWYNTMMIQFIFLMPLFWLLADWVANRAGRGWFVFVITSLGYWGWLIGYDQLVFHGPFMTNWYLLDRVFVSFSLYGIGGLLAWQFRKAFSKLLRFWPIILIIALGCFYWINLNLFHFGYPIKLANATYYRPSMAFYDLSVILLISAVGNWQINRQYQLTYLVHYLANYAYRAFLSTVFWQQLLRLIFGRQLIAQTPLIGIIVVYVGTWILSFTSAIIISMGWQRIKSGIFVHWRK